MVSIETLHLAAKNSVERGVVELDARVSAAIWDARNHGLKAVKVEGIYNLETFKDIEYRLIENRYNVFVTYSTPIVDVEDGQPTGEYFATVEIEW